MMIGSAPSLKIFRSDFVFFAGKFEFFYFGRKFFKTSAGPIRSHYKTLGVADNATSKQIKAAYYEQSKLHHPDMSRHPDAVKKFQKITEAERKMPKNLRLLMPKSPTAEQNFPLELRIWIWN